MRRPTRNLLYVVLGFLCVALLVQGVGLQMPRVLKMLTAVSSAAISSSPSSSPSVERQAASPVDTVASPDQAQSACTALSSIEAGFNETPIAEGSVIWFNSAIRVNGLGADAARIFLADSTISFAANGSTYNLAVPAATITFDPASRTASTNFDEPGNQWVTTVPSASSRVFLTGLAFPVPAGGLPGGMSKVAWSAALSTDTPGVTAQWQWAAAVYNTFGPDYNSLAIKPVDEQASQQSVKTQAMAMWLWPASRRTWKGS